MTKSKQKLPAKAPSPSPSKTGRPPHQPTDQTRKTVKAMAAYGIPQDKIAQVVGVTGPTLREHYRTELDVAEAEANARVAESLYKRATTDGPQQVSAAIFWLKTRAGWKEPPTRLQHSGPDDGPIQTETVSAKDVLMGRVARLAARGPTE